jgi:hypothetical protein
VPGLLNNELIEDSSTPWSADNYNFTVNSGNYEIIPADYLLVKLNNSTSIYGSDPTYSISSAQYFNDANEDDIAQDEEIISVSTTSVAGCTKDFCLV